MLVECRWRPTPASRLCAYPKCEKAGKFECVTHRWDGTFCYDHRSWHDQKWKATSAVLDSRPVVRGKSSSKLAGKRN